jgi:hypothetical protein
MSFNNMNTDIICIFPGPEWQLIAERPARKMSSIVLPGDTATAIAKDCSDFVTAEDWYADRGIPYRRGYLLHGMYCILGILAV